MCTAAAVHTPCIFEHVYLAREDSIMDEISIYKARLRMGERLVRPILERYSRREHDIDVVIPIPESSRASAIPLAYALNVKYREGFVKNRYIGRTFIMPEQGQRAKSVQQKLNAIDLEFRGRTCCSLRTLSCVARPPARSYVRRVMPVPARYSWP